MAISASSGVSDSIMASLRVQQAQRNAERAEVQARSLRASAAEAQNIADREQQNARALASQADRAESNAGMARLGVASLRANHESAQNLSKRLDVVIARLSPPATVAPAAAAPLETVASAPGPVINGDGQSTGTVISVTA